MSILTSLKELYRADGSAESRDAAESIDVTRLENLVLDAVRRAGLYGVTQSELLAQFPDYSYSSITARPSALKRKGLIFDSGARRKGKSSRSQAVLVAAEFFE